MGYDEDIDTLEASFWAEEVRLDFERAENLIFELVEVVLLCRFEMEWIERSSSESDITLFSILSLDFSF